MMKRLSITLLIISNFIGIHRVESANILFFFGVSTYSHRIPAWPLAEALAEKGHNVTFVSPIPAKKPNPNINDYVPKKLKEWVDSWEDLEDVFQDRKNNNVLQGWYVLLDFGVMMCDVIYQDEEFVKWVKESKMDLVFIDPLFNDCAYGMVHYWKAKTIVFGTTTAYSWQLDPIGLPDESSWISAIEMAFPLEMTFLERIKNALVPLAWNMARKEKYFSELESITKERLGIADLPKFEDIERNTNIVFLNTHYAEEFARSLPPNVIPIGGIAWVDDPNPLPNVLLYQIQDIKTFLDRGSQFIYLSFGTYADFNRMDTQIQQAIIGAIRSFPDVHFVWKVSNDSLLQEFPAKNVYINKWMPQQEILAHPKIKAFITHSGLLGIQEAVTCGVPLICFPIFAEQDYNAERIHRKEVGIRLEITSVEQHELEDAITKILTDPKYQNNMKRTSTLFKERPIKPLDLALWWTEFVLRHNEEELATLRPANIQHPWWKRRQIDVWITITVTCVAILAVTIMIVYKILRLVLCGRSSNSKPESSHKRKTQ